MSANRSLEQIATAPARQAETIGQITAVEQARAVAEVQAAVVVAQQVPRDMGRATAEMRVACGRLRLAERSFYAVKNRGTGPSVHLARELARLFGNVQYGVHELRRDDAAGISEIQAFAWDVEKNVRSTRTFVVPHARMVDKQRRPLTDLTDIYLSNQNIGARAVRECIFTILPTDFTDEAQDIARETLRVGEPGLTLEDRVANMIAAFAKLDVTAKQLEDRVGKRRLSWTPVDLAGLKIVGASLNRGETTKEDEFPHRVTAAEITRQATPPPPAGQPAEPDPVTGELPIEDPPADEAWPDTPVIQP